MTEADRTPQEKTQMAGNLARVYGKDWNALTLEERLPFMRIVEAVIKGSQRESRNE